MQLTYKIHYWKTTSYLNNIQRWSHSHVPSGVGRVKLHYVRKRKIDEYPIPTDAQLWIPHIPRTVCNAFIQEISQYQTKVLWSYYMHTAGRMWNRFACCWWTWAWPVFIFVGIIFCLALRNQRIERVRTWH